MVAHVITPRGSSAAVPSAHSMPSIQFKHCVLDVKKLKLRKGISVGAADTIAVVQIGLLTTVLAMRIEVAKVDSGSSTRTIDVGDDGVANFWAAAVDLKALSNTLVVDSTPTRLRYKDYPSGGTLIITANHVLVDAIVKLQWYEAPWQNYQDLES